MVNLKRDSQAQQALEETRLAKQQAAGKHPLIQQLAEKNEKLSEEISKTSEKLSGLTKEGDEIDQLTKRISTDYNSTKKKLEVAGLSQVLGQLFLEQKNNLPDEHVFVKKEKSREAQIARTGFLHLQHKDELLQMSDRDAYLEQLTESLTQQERQAVRPDLELLLNDRKNLLKKMTGIESSYIRMLDDMNFGTKNLQQAVARFNALLEKQLFWMRSSSIVSWENTKNLPEDLMRFLSKENWLDVYGSFVSSVHHSNVRGWGYVLVLILLLKMRQVKRLLINTGKKLGKISTDKFSYTFKALFYTLVLALPWPLMIAFTGQQLKLGDDPAAFTQAVSTGLIWIVMPLFYLLFFRNMCLTGGLADIHFKWHTAITQDLRRALGRLTITFLPVLFISIIIINHGVESAHEGMARFILLVTVAAFSLFFYRLFRRNKGILNPLIKEKPDSLLSRYQSLWLLLILIQSLGLLVLVLIGYVYTAGFLLHNLIHTVWFVFALIVIHQLILRWLLLSRRKLALKAAIERRQAAHDLKKSQQKNEPEKRQGSIEFVEPEIDLISLSNESNKLLKVVLMLIGVFGLAGIWSEVLPALYIFDDITLWYHSGIVNGEEKILPVTLGGAGTGLLVALLTIITARNLPSIIELILLQQPSISSGSRYTIKTLTNYTIIGIGTFSVLNILGAEWSKLQWLFAALSVGIGFGLQEIVANFISGIIILFERPIRVGDYVSVGDNEGIVSNIRIRATTILTFDRKELLVPNKEFITGQLLNWSLSDPTTRIIIPVGVAYGSDIPKARELLLQAAVKHERVLAEPAPQVVFYAFGDNTLDMQLRCFIGNVDSRLSTISELNEVINSKFNAAGITIAFPQRDVHLDLQQPIDIRLHKSRVSD
jgi:potassium efflux system protein